MKNNTIVKDHIFCSNLLPNMIETVNNEKITGIKLNTEALSFSVFLNQVTTFFKDKFQAITNIFKVNSSKKSDIQTLGLIGGTKNLKEELGKVGKLINTIYAYDGEDTNKLNKALKNIVIPAIPGVQPKFDTFVDGMVEQAKTLDIICEPSLDLIDDYVSKIVNDKDFRISTIPDKETMDKLINNGKNINNFLTKTINGKILADTRKFDEQYNGLKSLTTIQSKLIELTDLKSLDRVESIFKKCESIANKTNRLYDMIQKENVEISKPRLNELCSILQNGAQLTTDCTAIIRLVDVSIRMHTTVCFKIAVLI